ncbi:MAG TPA: TonB-dependent receptor, partial [Candidatus Polarisedimenticolaceae bacterium]|nr:TonB-dependent receptor [Candidatus Polarisedimenticolaceae bacterium]
RLAVDADGGDGWRERSGWEDVRGSVRLGGGTERRRWRAGLWLRSDDHEIPGSLPRDLFESAPRTSLDPFDEARRKRATLGWQEARRGDVWQLDSHVSLRVQDDRITETLLTETKQRRFDGSQLWAEQRAQRAFGTAGRHALVCGVELFADRFGSQYFDVDAQGDAGAETADGDGRRRGVGAYAQAQLAPAPPVRVLLGIRADRVHDRFDESRIPDVSARASHGAWAPRAGVLWTPRPGTGLYVNAARTFRVPTPFQLFDQRRPFGVPVTNDALEPQVGRNVGLGWRQDAGRRGHAEIALYQLDLKDEIGFDPVAFRLENIGRSRHRGVEASFDWLHGPFSLALSWTLQDARFRSGDFDGNRIDNVPRSTGTLAASWTRAGWQAGLVVRSVRDAFLDPGETERLPDYETVALRLSRAVGAFDIRLEGHNLLDEEYASWGFLSPLDGTPRYYPATARTVTLDLRYRTGGP